MPRKFRILNPKNYQVIFPLDLYFSQKVDYFLACSIASVCY